MYLENSLLMFCNKMFISLGLQSLILFLSRICFCQPLVDVPLTAQSSFHLIRIPHFNNNTGIFMIQGLFSSFPGALGNTISVCTWSR